MGLVGVGVARDGRRMADLAFHIHAWRFVSATALEVALLMWGVALWSRIVARFNAPSPTFGALLTVWRRSTLAKYLPGSVWSTIAAAEMAEDVGSSSIVLGAAFLLQAAFTLIGATATAAALVHVSSPLILPGLGVPMLRLVAIGALGSGLILAHPESINALVSLGARISGRAAPRWTGRWRDGALLLSLHVITWVAYGWTFALFFSSIVPGSPASWNDLAARNALAFGVGFIAFFAPGGIGVREGALVVLLAPFVPALGSRIAIAAASRLWLVLTEGVGAVVAQVVVTRRPRGRTTRAAAPATSTSAMAAGASDRHHDARRPVIRGMHVEVLTDSGDALPHIVEACRTARRSITIAQLAFDPDCIATHSLDGSEPRPLLDVIMDASNRTGDHGAPVDVRILLNGGLLLDTTPALRRALALSPNRIRLRAMKAFPQMMHAKMVIVDEHEVFLMGSSFVNGYWEGARHRPAGDPAARPNTGDRPLHDAAVHLTGPAAVHYERWFDELWNAAVRFDDERPTPPPRVDTPGQRRDGASSVRVLRTSPANLTTAQQGHTEILDEYIDAIGRARSTIYLESQYFSARPVAAALRRALDSNPGLEAIVVINQNPDITAYRAWQDARLAEQSLLDHPRVGVFALWSTVPSLRRSGISEITQVFVHSKVAVIDDVWATVGTANLDGASLHSYGDDFSSAFGRRIFGAYRNIDVNVALLDGIESEPRTGAARQLRAELWARHTGGNSGDFQNRPPDGWLPMWRKMARDNVEALARGDGGMPHGHVLPYAPTAKPRAQLAALGIDCNTAGLDLRFDPGLAETLWSPGWMKRLLPEKLRWD